MRDVGKNIDVYINDDVNDGFSTSGCDTINWNKLVVAHFRSPITRNDGCMKGSDVTLLLLFSNDETTLKTT
jgi:hypothetical protein